MCIYDNNTIKIFDSYKIFDSTSEQLTIDNVNMKKWRNEMRGKKRREWNGRYFLPHDTFQWGKKSSQFYEKYCQKREKKIFIKRRIRSSKAGIAVMMMGTNSIRSTHKCKLLFISKRKTSCKAFHDKNITFIHFFSTNFFHVEDKRCSGKETFKYKMLSSILLKMIVNYGPWRPEIVSEKCIEQINFPSLIR